MFFWCCTALISDLKNWCLYLYSSIIFNMLRLNVNQNSTDIKLIKYCVNPPFEKLFNGAFYGNKIMQIFDQIMIKFGVKVINAKTVNQSAVYKLVDFQIIRVSKVYHCFLNNENQKYIIMNFVKNEILNSLKNLIKIKLIIDIIDHFVFFCWIVFGFCAYESFCELFFFSDEKKIFFTDVINLEQWWNCKLLTKKCIIKFQNFKQVFCHLNVTSRNIL